MKIVPKDLRKHLQFSVYKHLLINAYWKFPDLLEQSFIQPRVIEIELTNHCNLACVECYRWIETRKRGFMDIELFKNLVDEIASYPTAFLRVVGVGESSMHPQLPEFMNYLRGKKIKTEFTTNGYIFNKYSSKEILDWNIDILGISIDGIDGESYEKIRVNGNYKRLRENVTQFYVQKKKQNQRHPMVVIRNVIFPEFSEEEIRNFKKDWKEISDQVTFNTLLTFEKNKEAVGTKRCKEFFFNAHIRWDGSVLICPKQFIWADNEIIGNLRHKSLAEVWQSTRLMEMRHLHQSQQFPEFCKSCSFTDKSQAEKINGRRYNYSQNPVINFLNRFVDIT